MAQKERGWALYRHTLALSFIIVLFFFFLDLNYRSGNIISYLDPFTFVKNALFMITFLCACSFLLAGIVWGADYILYIFIRLLSKITGKKISYPTGLLSDFLLFFAFVYVNLMYFKFYLGLFTSDVKKTLIPVGVILVISVICYFLHFRKKLNYKKLSPYTPFIFKAGVMVFAIAFMLSVIIFLADSKTSIEKTSSFNKKTHLPNIIIVTFDSLNAKHMSTYGYPKKTTPNIDKLAKESFVFAQMRTNANYTIYALPAILGQYPREHVEKSFITTLKKAGYRKRYFISYFNVKKDFQKDFTQCLLIGRFEKSPIYHFLSKGKNRRNLQWLVALLSEDEQFFNLFVRYDLRDFHHKKIDSYPIELIFKFMLEKLKTEKGPIFIWAHVFEPHFPYHAGDKFKGHFGNSLEERYENCILYADDAFGKFLKELKKSGIYDKSILIVSADHGESFGESHGGWRAIFHSGHWLNESVNHIPLIIHLPHQKNRVTPKTFAELVDIAPTILDLIGVKKPQWMEGESLLPYMKDPNKLSKKLKIVVPKSHFVRKYRNLSKKPANWAVVNEDMFNVYWYKYKIGWIQVYARNPKNKKLVNRFVRFQYYCIYDMYNDPHEKHNLLKDSKFDKLLDYIYESPLVTYYRTYYPKANH